MDPLTSASERAIDRTERELLLALRAQPELLSLAEATPADRELQVQGRLRLSHSPELVRAAFALVALRRKAADKFTRADRMWFDRAGLEQSTAEPVARHKARRFFEHAAGRSVVDLCCGIGGDTLALAEKLDVTAIDQSEAQTQRTEWNAAVYDVAERVSTICGEVLQRDLPPGLVHIDPDRRAGGSERALRIEDYRPGLDDLRRLAATCRAGAIKLGPASNFGGKFPNTEIELISLHGECKEATVWFGDLRGQHDWRATLLPSGLSLAGDPLQHAAPLSAPAACIYDPDPAVVRAGLVDLLAEQLNLLRLDREEEYLTAASPLIAPSPAVREFELLANLPNNPTEIRRYFRESQFGQVEIKCRHIPIDAAAVRRKLPLPGDAPVTLIFARVDGRARALVCRRSRPPNPVEAPVRHDPTH